MIFDTFLFDLDGTLIDSVADIAAAVNLLRSELSLHPLDLPAVRANVGDGAAMLVRRSLPEDLFSDERLGRFLSLYGEHLLESTTVYPGIRDFLELHRQTKMAVVTNKPHRLSVELLEGLDLSTYFQVVVGGDDGLGRKPDPAPILHALRKLAAAPEQAVLIGDHRTDLAAGRAAGVRTCFCAWGIGQDGGLPYDFRAETPHDLPALFPPERS